MSMQELTDDQLDGLFRKSSEEFDPPFDPAAWQAMQNKLDVHQPTGTPFNWKLLGWGLPILLLLLISGVWYTYRLRPSVDHAPSLRPAATTSHPAARPDLRSAESSNAVTRPSETATTATPDRVPAAERHQRAGNERIGQATDALRKEPNAEALLNARERVATVKPVRKPRTEALAASRFSNPKPANREQRLAEPSASVAPRTPSAGVAARQVNRRPYETTVTRRKQRRPRVFSETAYAITGPAAFSKQPVMNPVEDELTAALTEPVTPDAAERVSFPGLAKLAIRPVRPMNSSAAILREVSKPEPDERPATVVAHWETGLSVRFLVSPDLSAVGLHNFARPGTNVGLLAEYRFAARWSVQAGVLRSTKVYKARAADYESLTYSSWAVQPESVGGRCNMLDIPINLRYDVALRPRSDGRLPSRWFLSGGVTTYVMLREDYTYNYAMPNNPLIKYRDWSTSTGRYGFSQLNVSAGYERSFSRRLSWQVEPFLKVPLRGVGFYKLNLLSTGAFLSIRYKL